MTMANDSCDNCVYTIIECREPEEDEFPCCACVRKWGIGHDYWVSVDEAFWEWERLTNVED